ncbi:MAG TPA: FmdB family zinc ribbon protein, partial [Burkholderiaceae bacterium]|nr:FmdB family zinc ribbon protein [Burkholderiaceae bacterium]
YKCTDCGHEKEVLQKINDAPLTDCPDCGRPSMAKMVTAAGFQLKGSGWYATDFRNKESGGKNSKPDGKTESANDAKADSGASSTPAASTHACGTGGCASCS